MAVYKRSYRPYTGALTPRWSRFWILSRYAMRGIFKSRILTGLYVISLLYPIVLIALMYLNHNAKILSLIKFDRDHLFDVGGSFFFVLMTVQSSIAFLVTAFIGPNMIAPDLANGGLPLYFCRPLSRVEYVLGKALPIAVLLSFITWVPGLIVFCVEWSLSGTAWAWNNINLAGGVVLGSFLWITVLSMLALALSAWVRWKLVAGALILAVMFLSSGFATAIWAVMRTQAGRYIDPAFLVTLIYARLFDYRFNSDISVASACIALVVICSFFVFLLQKKVRAFEVVR
jgi:ABC-2 type transport system permease protein